MSGDVQRPRRVNAAEDPTPGRSHQRMKAYYDRRAPEYDRSIPGVGDVVEAPEAAKERYALLRVLTGMPPAKTLDVGCGTGYVTRNLPGELTGLDQSEAMIEIARRRVPDATFVVGDALELPFADLSFQRIFSSNVYGLLQEPERARFLSEARRVARELVIGEPTLRFSPDGQSEGFEERVLSDGSRHEIYRRYFDAGELAKELNGRALYAGGWFSVVVART
jgi:SAM-dependent methyltransferase